MNYIVRVVVSFILILMIASPAPGQSAGGYDINDSSLDQRFDWVVTVQVKILKDYLKYPSSSLNPMTKLSVAYRLTPRLQKDREAKIVQFEDLWYHECQAIGCRRYSELGLIPGQQGAIRVIPSEDTNNSTCAVANALTRLMLDIGLMRCSVGAIYIPVAALDGVTNDLGRFNFFAFTPQPEKALQTSMVLYITSDPPGQVRHLYYSPPNQ